MPRSRRAVAREGKRKTFPIPLYDDMERLIDAALARTSMAKVELVARVLKFFSEQDEGMQNLILGLVENDRADFAELLLKKIAAEKSDDSPGSRHASVDMPPPRPPRR